MSTNNVFMMFEIITISHPLIHNQYYVCVIRLRGKSEAMMMMNKTKKERVNEKGSFFFSHSFIHSFPAILSLSLRSPSSPFFYPSFPRSSLFPLLMSLAIIMALVTWFAILFNVSRYCICIWRMNRMGRRSADIRNEWEGEEKKSERWWRELFGSGDENGSEEKQIMQRKWWLTRNVFLLEMGSVFNLLPFLLHLISSSFYPWLSPHSSQSLLPLRFYPGNDHPWDLLCFPNTSSPLSVRFLLVIHTCIT